MRLKKKWKPAELTQRSMHLLHQFESDLQTIEDRPLVAVVQEPTEEPEDRLTHEEALERWMLLSGLLQTLRLSMLQRGESSWVTVCGECIAMVNELAADRELYPDDGDEQDSLRKQNST